VADGLDPRTLDGLLADASARITRYSPEEAKRATDAGALLIDIRSDSNRERDGITPGSIHIPRTVLEWRTDVGGPWCNPHVGDRDQPIILLCDHGYSTILAAATLTELGFTRVGDVIGGFAEWRNRGLPTMHIPTNGTPRDQGDVLGMNGPDRPAATDSPG